MILDINYLPSHFPPTSSHGHLVAGLGTLPIPQPAQAQGNLNTLPITSLEHWDTQRDEGQGSLCPLDAQIHYVSIFSSHHHHELGGLGGTRQCCYSLRYHTGRRFRITLSPILKSYSSRAVKKTEGGEIGHPLPIVQGRSMNYDLTCFISTCSSLYLIRRGLSFAQKLWFWGPLFLNWSVLATSPLVFWVCEGLVHTQN